MRILVCLKQVRDPQSRLEISQGRPSWPGPPRRKMSAWDEAALELALRHKDAAPQTEVLAVSVGPEPAADVLRRALGMGADQAMHLLAPEEPPARPAALAGWIAAWARDISPDLVLTGVMSEDAMQGQVGPFLARALGLPLITSVREFRADPQKNTVIAEREMEGGRCQVLEADLPALLTVQSSAHQPRYPTLSKLLKAKQASIPARDTAQMARKPDRERAGAWSLPGRRRAGLTLQGTTRQKAAQLWRILRERGLA